MRLLLLLMLILLTSSSFGQDTDTLLVQLKNHPEEDSVRYMLLKKLAYQYSFSEPEKGVAAADAAIALAKKLNSDVKLAGAYSNKATNLHKLGADSEALALYRIAINLHLNADYKKGAANAYFNMAYVYFDIGNYYMAINQELKALELYKVLDLVSDEADAYNSIADNYMRLDDYPSALKNFMKALNIYQQLDEKENEAMVLSNIGMTYHSLNDSAKAFAYYKRALLIDEQIQNKSNLAHDYQHIGILYDDAKQYDKALAYFQKALDLNKEINDERNIAGNFINIAASYTSLKNYSSAYGNINNALDIYKTLTDKYNIASALNEKGKLLANSSNEFLAEQSIKITNKYSQAISYQQQAFLLAKETGSYSLMAQILGDMSEVYEKNSDFKNALNAYKEAVVLRDTILNDDQKKAITRLEMQYDFDKKEAVAKALADKKQAVAAQEIQKQKLIRNISILTGFIFLSAVIISFIFYRKRKDALTQKKEADLKTEITETEMKALRAQMNPHFIFNSLNSIADYIDKHQSQVASDFAAKFAKLMRMVLENSERKEVPLSDDLKALELYIQLERLRLNNKFDYQIKTDESIDLENTMVPPLILQPFVENSIWHGISKKDGSGNIEINIKKQNGMIQCTVEDDGGGISETTIINKEKRSLGMKITKARIDIINKIKNSNASINVSNTNSGVRAEVMLPIELNF